MPLPSTSYDFIRAMPRDPVARAPVSITADRSGVPRKRFEVSADQVRSSSDIGGAPAFASRDV